MRFPRVLNRLAAGESPNIVAERTAFLGYFQTGLRVLNGAVYLELVAHNAFIREQLFDLGVSITGNFGGIKLVECLPVSVALLQNRQPTQAGLCTLKN